MGLGPQCWTCRSRRVRCTSEQPSCQKCDDRALVCAGYGPTKPVRWKQPTCKDAPPGRVVSQVSSQGLSPTLDVLMKREVPERESVSLPTSIELSPEMRIVIYAMQYRMLFFTLVRLSLLIRCRQRCPCSRSCACGLTLQSYPLQKRFELDGWPKVHVHYSCVYYELQSSLETCALGSSGPLKKHAG